LAAALLHRLFHAPPLDRPVQGLEPVDDISLDVTLAAHGVQVLAGFRMIQEALHKGNQRMRPGMALACGARRK
jgi:hypothetical protein